MKFNDPTEVKIEKTEKKVEKESQKETVTEESAEEKKNLLDYLFYGERIGCMLYIGMHMFMGAM